jgi:opacity protein-like surface antigen
MAKWRGVFGAAAAALALTAGSAEAQRFGPSISWSDDFDLGIGARMEYDLPNLFTSEGPFSRTFLIASFDYFFPDCASVDCSFWQLNGNFAVPITATNLNPYAGAGIGIARASVSFDGIGSASSSNTEVGLNLLGGLQFRMGSLNAFSEAWLQLGGGEQFGLTFGLLFGR